MCLHQCPHCGSDKFTIKIAISPHVDQILCLIKQFIPFGSFPLSSIFMTNKNENTWAFMHLPRRTFYVLSPKWCHFVMSRDGVTSGREVTWRPDIIPWAKVLYHAIQISTKLSTIGLNHNFSIRWPWPLTYDLDHHTWSRCGLGRCLCKISCPHIKRFSRESVH